MIRSLEGHLAEDLERLREAYNEVLGYLPPHLMIHRELDEHIAEKMVRELRLLAADFMLTADMIERSLQTWRGDND